MGIKIGGGVKIPTTIGQYDLGIERKKIDFGRLPGAGTGGAQGASGPSDEEVLGGLIEDMYGRFAPEQYEYGARSAEDIRSSVAAWLRPNYDQAVLNRQEQTRAYKASLDADAIGRGMGSSTYVTDVKNRQQNAEARDIATLEADYGAALARYVSDGIENESDRAFEIEQFNAEQRQNAYELAYSAALQLFERYKKQPQSGSSGTSAVKATSRENCEAFLGMLSQEERSEIYGATTAAGQQYRAELLASVGEAGYVQLMDMFPSAP